MFDLDVQAATVDLPLGFDGSPTSSRTSTKWSSSRAFTKAADRFAHERDTGASLITLLAKKRDHVATIATASPRLPLAARTGLHAFLRRPAKSASGVRRESRFRDANGVRDPNVPEFALRAELVDGGGADPKEAGGFANGQKSAPHSALGASGL